MARKAREKSKSGIYHAILRGVNRQNIFEDDEDKRKFLEILEKSKEKSECLIFAYCLMNNHVHILLQEMKESVGMTIKRVSSSYVLWYNSKYKRCGHLFQERFRSETVENDSYFLTVLRYIHKNPVTAGIANDIAEYQWSSYREYIGGNRVIDKEFALSMFSNIPEEAVKKFAKYSHEESMDVCLEIEERKIHMDDDALSEIVRRQFGIEAKTVGSESRERQDHIVRELKKLDGVTIRQVARLTGLSQTRVWKA